MKPEEMEIGKRYRIWHKSDTERSMRSSVMDYLGHDGRDYQFNARPVAGTQAVPAHWIKYIEEVYKTTPIVLNQITAR